MFEIFKLSDVFLEEKIDFRTIHDAEQIIGALILNRIGSIAINNIDLSTLYPEFRKILRLLNEEDKKKTLEFKNNLIMLSKVLSRVGFKYAFLKGAFLATELYPVGQRTSNDIDILIEGKDISKLQDILYKEGFVQGYLNEKNEISLATRKEIIKSRMNFGETIPFLKMVDGKPMAVDINFSLDFKPGNDVVVSEFLDNSVVIQNSMRLHTLNAVDFLIHLCCHLYKEATTYNWVLTRRDLMLYKFSDINVFLHEYGIPEYFCKLVGRITELEVEKECYYTFENSSIIYPRLNDLDGFVYAKDAMKPHDVRFMTRIICPRGKKLFQYDMNFVDWFFCSNRTAELKEIDCGEDGV